MRRVFVFGVAMLAGGGLPVKGPLAVGLLLLCDLAEVELLCDVGVGLTLGILLCGVAGELHGGLCMSLILGHSCFVWC